MKKCYKCGVEKPPSCFYMHKGNKDRLLGKCKDCCKKDSSRNRQKNIDRIREYDRQRGNRQSPSYLKKWREENPTKYKAHSMVNNNIRSGNLHKEPCEICGNNKSVAHHDDYSKPLNVRWLCQAHHKQWHAKHGEGLNP